MRRFSLGLTGLLAAALAMPAFAAPAIEQAPEGYVLLAKKDNQERGRGDGRREERRGRNGRDQGGDSREYREHRSISRGEAAERAQREAPGRVLGIQRQHDDDGYSVNVLDERGRLRTIRVPAEDERGEE